MGQVIVFILVMLVFVIPGWVIFKKAGFSPFWSLMLFVPFLGLLVALIILAFAKWPNQQATMQ